MKKKCVVIGAGLSGTLIANRLSEHCDVSIVERGPSRSIEYPNVVYDQRELAHIKTFCYGKGGTTNLWHNGLIPISPNDVHEPTNALLLDASAKYRNDAAHALHFEGNDFDEQYELQNRVAAELAENFCKASDGVDTLIYPKRVGRLALSPDVSGVYDVTDLAVTSNGNRIQDVAVSTPTGSVRLPCDELIISAGSLGTPIVLNKVLGEMPVNHTADGHGLIDHPMGFVGKVRFPRSLKSDVSQFSLASRGTYHTRSLLRLKSECGHYTGCIFLRPAFTMENSLESHIYKSQLGASSGLERLKNAMSKRLFHPDVLAEAFTRLSGFSPPTQIYSVLFLGEQRNSRNAVYAKDEQLHVDWQVHADEIEIYSNMLEKFRSMIQDFAEDISLTPELTQNWLWSGAHHSGTTHCVDENLLVDGTENLYVCDASVIHEHSYANTGLTIGSLAFRLCEHIAGRLH
ncbi:MAG: GMC oxidoreductase [Pseudomonadota bacterium]